MTTAPTVIPFRRSPWPSRCCVEPRTPAGGGTPWYGRKLAPLVVIDTRSGQQRMRSSQRGARRSVHTKLFPEKNASGQGLFIHLEGITSSSLGAVLVMAVAVRKGVPSTSFTATAKISSPNRSPSLTMVTQQTIESCVGYKMRPHARSCVCLIQGVLPRTGSVVYSAPHCKPTTGKTMMVRDGIFVFFFSAHVDISSTDLLDRDGQRKDPNVAPR